MNWYRILYMDAVTTKVFECQANDEKDAIFQFKSQFPNNEIENLEEFLPTIKPNFVRVHHGYITVNLIPEVAETLGYKEGDRLATFNDFMNVVEHQNNFIVDDWFNRTGNEKPIDKLEAFSFMVESFQNAN